ncbi:MAG: phosphoribosylformylglycinamidine cyclo-ligase [Pseudomonadota bacterium]
MSDERSHGSTGLSYQDAGVDIAAGNAFVERIKPLVKATERLGSAGELGGFGGLFDLQKIGLHDPILVSATDGVGTKLLLAIEYGCHNGVGIDLVAMCVNDLVVQGAEPLFFLDYFATGKLDSDLAAEVVAGVAEGCRQAGCALLGGETAEMPDMYEAGHYDLAGFSVGAVERAHLIDGSAVQIGDRIIGARSNGIHSNGFSLVRKILERAGPSAANAEIDGVPLIEALMAPTRIYVKSALAAARRGQISAIAHITGGGLTENIPRVLPSHTRALIDLDTWSLPPLFGWFQDRGDVSQSEMLKTFNCGIGMIFVVGEDDVEETIATLNSNGEIAFEIGRIEAGHKNTDFIGELD